MTMDKTNISPNGELLMLGTGHATVTYCYNACFVLRLPNYSLLVDGGGGNGILRQLNLAGVPLQEISSIFVSHAHLDHLLGVIWVLRMMGETGLGGCTVYGHGELLGLVQYVCRNTLSHGVWRHIRSHIRFMAVQDQQKVKLHKDLIIQALCVGASDMKQYGFLAFLPSGKTLAFTGDVPCEEHILTYLYHADWLMREAFCLDSDKEIFHPHTLGHGTVLEAAKGAEQLKVKNLILFHTEDTAIPTRKEQYAKEAAMAYSGKVYVPNDLDVITL